MEILQKKHYLPALIQPQRLKKLSPVHIAIARAMAAGIKNKVIKSMYHYCDSRLSILKSDPLFRQQLILENNSVAAAAGLIGKQVDALGANSAHELQSRLDTNPAEFSNKDLLEIVKIAIPAKVEVKSESFIDLSAIIHQTRDQETDTTIEIIDVDDDGVVEDSKAGTR